MANRPLPNVDPDALSKLASQYPGSGDVRPEPKLGGGTGGGSGAGGSDGGAGKGGAPRGASAAKPAAAPRSVGRTGIVVALICALISVAAALVAIAAPSLRTEARAFLQRNVPQLNATTVDFITGQDTRRLEVTYEGLDQRITRLTEALDRLVGKPGIDAATARELLLRTEENQRLAATVAGLDGQTKALAAASDRIGAVEERLAAIDALRQSVDGLTAQAEATDQSLAELRDTIGGLSGALASLSEADARGADAVASLTEKVDAVAAAVAKAHEDLAPVAALTNQVAEQRRAMELPLIGITQLRIALDSASPFRIELALAKRLVGDDSVAQGALSTLDDNAGSGVTTLPGLRRDFTFVASQMGASLNRIQSWTQRLSSWVEVLVGTRSVPEADPIGQMSAAVASIDAALEAGQLDLAIEEAIALNERQGDVLLEGWISEARRRLATERAYDRLSERIYARIGTPG